MNYYVIDGDDNITSYSEKLDEYERFKTESAASARALQLATTEPSKVFYICKAIKAVTCPVGPVKVTNIA